MRDLFFNLLNRISSGETSHQDRTAVLILLTLAFGVGLILGVSIPR